MGRLLRFFVWFLGGIGLLILGSVFQKPIDHVRDWIDKKFTGEARTLEQATAFRTHMAENDLESAIEKYKSLNRPDTDKTIKFKADWGLSRAYADLTNLRFWRGLSRREYPDHAITSALDAERENPGQFETAVALAYSYYSYESYRSDKKGFPLTLAKARELQASHADDPDVKFLVWLATRGPATSSEMAGTFTDDLHPEALSDLRILLDVGMDYVTRAEHTTDAARKKHDLDRAGEFFARAKVVGGDNSLVLFSLGYLAFARDLPVEARDYYRKAIDKETDFPRARDNLGFVYFALGDYSAAREQFEAVTLTENAPIRTQITSLRNLGDAYIELGNNVEGCKAWPRAAQIPGSPEDAIAHVERAICSHVIKKDDTEAQSEYAKAIRNGDEEGVDLRKASTVQEKWKTGPKQLGMIDALIKLTVPPPSP